MGVEFMFCRLDDLKTDMQEVQYSMTAELL